MRRLAFGTLGSLLSCAALVVACGGGTSNGNGSSIAVTSNSFVQQYCDLVVPCCATVMKMGTSAGCQQVYNALLGSSITYDPAAGSKCLDAVRAAQPKPDFCTAAPGSADCNHVFKQGSGGTKQPGEACMQDGDCAPSSEGDVTCASFSTGMAQTRICQVQIDGKAGDMPCFETRDGNSAIGFGGPANGMPPPAKAFICDVANGVACSSKTSTCVTIPDVGQPCDPSVFEYACVKAGFCDSATKTCLARLAAGASCAKQPNGCVATAYCDTMTMNCVAALAAGAPCKTSQQCGQNASCTNGACQSYSSGGNLALDIICR